MGRFISEDTIGFAGEDANLYRYVFNTPVNAIDPTGERSQSYYDQLNVLTDIVNPIDQALSGISSVSTLGLSTNIRRQFFPEVAAQNDRGFIFTGGQVVGVVASIGIGALTPNVLTGVTTAQRIAQGYTVVSTGIGAYQSTRKIIEGCATPLDYLAFAPAIGFGAKIVFSRLSATSQLLSFDDLIPELSGLPLSYEIKHINKDLPGTKKAAREIQEGSAHVFNNKKTLSQVEQAILARGQYTGNVRGSQRYDLQFEEPIGYRIGKDGRTIPLHYGELKVSPDGRYRVIPRTGSSS